MQKQYFEVGKIVGIRGLRGEIKVQSWCDSLQVFCDIKNFYWDYGIDKIDIEYVKAHKSIVLMKINNVNTPEDAISLVNNIIYSLKDDIPKNNNSYFIEEIKGLNVVDSKDGHSYGILSDVLKVSSNDIYKVVSPNGNEYLIPAISDIISEININKKKILVNYVEGLFNNAD